jgi:hypothetical protein
LPNLWTTDIYVHITPIETPTHDRRWTEDHELPFTLDTNGQDRTAEEAANEHGQDRIAEEAANEHEQDRTAKEDGPEDGEEYTPQDFERGEWLDPANITYGRGKRRLRALYSKISAFTHGEYNLGDKHAYVTLADDEPFNFREAMKSTDANEWKSACQLEFDMLMDYGTWTLVERPPNTNIVGN